MNDEFILGLLIWFLTIVTIVAMTLIIILSVVSLFESPLERCLRNANTFEEVEFCEETKDG